MNRKVLMAALAWCACSVAQGCTYRAWYDGAREGQRQDCYRNATRDDLRACLEKADAVTYDQYVKEREAMKDRPK